MWACVRVWNAGEFDAFGTLFLCTQILTMCCDPWDYAGRGGVERRRREGREKCRASVGPAAPSKIDILEAKNLGGRRHTKLYRAEEKTSSSIIMIFIWYTTSKPGCFHRKKTSYYTNDRLLAPNGNNHIFLRRSQQPKWKPPINSILKKNLIKPLLTLSFTFRIAFPRIKRTSQ